MTQRFKCKDPGCDKEVEYEYEPVAGTFMKTEFNVEVEVYLTCENGHTHKYKVIKVK